MALKMCPTQFYLFHSIQRALARVYVFAYFLGGRQATD